MLLDWRVLGICAWRPAGSGTRVRVSVRRDRYFSEWASINPSVSVSGGAFGWQPPPAPIEAPSMSFLFDRKIPALLLAVLVAAIALHHWYAKSGGHVLIAALCVMMGVAFLAAGGVVYPPVLWSIGVYGKQLPLPVKVVGAFLGLAGLVTGFLLGISYGHP
jgi:hypothetical protein